MEQEQFDTVRVVNETDIKLTRAIDALKIIKSFNNMENDYDMYLLAIARWGCGEEKEKPNSSDYGI